MKIQGAIFDLDGTLIDSLPVWKTIQEAISVRFNHGERFEIGVEELKHFITMPLAKIATEIHENYKLGNSAEELLALMEQLDREGYQNTVPLKPGIRELLESLKEHGVRLCVASASATEMVRIPLRRLGVDHYFDGFFSCADPDIGKSKEHPDVFLAAARFLQTPIEKTWVFEDSAVPLHTARSVGFPTVGLYDAFSPDQEAVKEGSTLYLGAGHTAAEAIPYFFGGKENA